MLATKRVAVTGAVWMELSDLRRPGETFSQLLADMIGSEISFGASGEVGLVAIPLDLLKAI